MYLQHLSPSHVQYILWNEDCRLGIWKNGRSVTHLGWLLGLALSSMDDSLTNQELQNIYLILNRITMVKVLRGATNLGRVLMWTSKGMDMSRTHRVCSTTSVCTEHAPHANIPNVRFLISLRQRPVKIWATERKRCCEVVWGKTYLQSLEEQWNLPGQHLFLLTHHNQDWVVKVLRRTVHMHPHGVDLWVGQREVMHIPHAQTHTGMRIIAAPWSPEKLECFTFTSDHRQSKRLSCVFLTHIVTTGVSTLIAVLMWISF